METLKDLGKEYQQCFSSLAPYRDSVWRVLVNEFFQQYVDPRSTVLDLGSGWGEFIRHIQAERRIAMDLNPDMPGRVDSGVETILQDCVRAGRLTILHSMSCSRAIFLNIFHTRMLFEERYKKLRCLKDGGRLICLGPNIRFLNGSYWDFWDHFVPLTDRAMVEILTLIGFTIERVEPRFLPYTMSQAFTPPIGLISLYIRAPFLWRFFGKQFLIVAKGL